jgi:hypothetical protein
VAVTVSGGYGGLAFNRSSSALSTSGLSSISFWVHGGSSGTRQLQVVSNTATNGSGSWSPAYSFDAPAGSWTQITVPLSSLGSPSQIGLFAIQDRSGSSQPTFYVDNVQFN